MGRFLPFLMVVLLIGCSQTPGGAPTGAASAASGSPGGPTAGAPSSTASPSSSASTSGVLPAKCAEGLGAYLKAIEPIVASFNPAKATLGDLTSADQATSDKAFDLLNANGGRAPYSCSEVSLEWAYFDSKSPWDAVLAVAADAAPGTVAYLTGLRATKALDLAKLSDYGIAGCDEAVKTIQERVAAQKASGKKGVEKMPFNDGVKLLGLYKAYIGQVQTNVCPRDALGNNEFDFFGAAG